MFKIAKQFSFSASHRLSSFPPGHLCRNVHGHNYVVEIELSATTLDERGVVVDYGQLDALKEFIDDNLDHQDLNDAFDRLDWPQPTTSEHIARCLFYWCRQNWPETTAVRISETPKTWAEYRPTRRSDVTEGQ